MDKLINQVPIQHLLDSMLKDSIKAMLTAGLFYRYIGEQVKNGFIRSKFIRFSEEESKNHKKLLNDRLMLIDNNSCVSDSDEIDRCKEVASYSLIGALHIAKESVRNIIKMCKEERQKDGYNHDIYDGIIKDEKQYFKAIRKEEKFSRSE